MNRRRLAASLVVVFALLLVLSGQARFVHAATTVTQPVSCTMDNGGPAVTVTLAASDGSIPSPASVVCDGSANNITVDASVSLTATEPADGASSRARFGGGAISTSLSTCSTGSCTAWSFTNYDQLLNTWQITAAAQASFDVSMSVTFIGTQAGTPGSTICSIASTTASSTNSCSGWSDYGRSVVVPATLTNPQSGSRWENAAGGSSSLSPTTGGNVENTNFFKQWQLIVYYSVVGGGSPTAPSFECLSLGSAGYTVMSTSPIGVWVDNGCGWTVSPDPLSGSGPGERWDSSNQMSGTVAGALTVSPAFYHQFDFRLSYSVAGGGSPTGPSFSFTQFGSQLSSALTTSPADYWLDSGSSWSVSNPTVGSTSTERWDTSGATTGTVSSSSSLSLTFYHQYDVPFTYSLSGGGSGYSAPLLTYTSFGRNAQATLSTSGSRYWLDVGSSWASASLLSGSSGFERWSAKAFSGNASSQSPVALAYYHQYLATTSYTVLGGGTAYTGPSMSFLSYGFQSSAPFGTPVWVDAGSEWSVNNQLTGSSSAERWETNASTVGTTASRLTISLTYFHQYHVIFGYSVTGGGAGYSPPEVETSRFGTPVSESSGWADAGSHYTYTNPLNGSSPSERWYSGSGRGVVMSSSLVNATYFHQYDFVLSYRTTGAKTQLPPPTLDSIALGLPFSANLQTTPASYWLDSGSNWLVSAALPGSGSTERWMTDQATSGRASTSSTSVLTYFDQYAVGFSYTVQGGGSPAPPSINYTSFSAPVGTTLGSTRAVYWLDSGSSWFLTNPIAGLPGSERWIAAKGTNGTALNSFNETAAYTHQYYLAVKRNVQAGGTIQLNSGWFDAGTSAMLNATASTGWRFSRWTGEGTGSYSGSNSTATISFGSAVNETAVFYAGLGLTSESGGFVQYRYGQLNGSVPAGGSETLYVAPGTVVNLTSRPATAAYRFAGWSGKITGTAQNATLAVTAPVIVHAAFDLDYTDIGVFYVVAIVVTVLAVYVFVIRRRHLVVQSGHLAARTDQYAPSARFLYFLG